MQPQLVKVRMGVDGGYSQALEIHLALTQQPIDQARERAQKYDKHQAGAQVEDQVDIGQRDGGSGVDLV